jgi:putative transposase
MTPPAAPERYKNHRFPGEIISHGVWLYYRFPLSYRDVQELLCERGIDVTHEAIRQWCLKFGQDYANRLKHRRAQPWDKWHLDGHCQVVGDDMVTRQQQALSGGDCHRLSL